MKVTVSLHLEKVLRLLRLKEHDLLDRRAPIAPAARRAEPDEPKGELAR